MGKLITLITISSFISACAGTLEPPIETELLQSSGNENSSSQTNGQCGTMDASTCEVFNLVNLERINQGLTPLEISDKCVDVAQDHAEDMDVNNYFSHNGLNETWQERFTRYGISGVRAENIARSSGPPAQVLQNWLSSSGHRANIFNGNLRYAGVGHSNEYWVQCFSSNP